MDNQALKMEQDRERNRMNARNTRLKKKQHVDMLKAKVERLSEQKEEFDRKRSETEAKAAEELKKCCATLEKVMQMRSAGVIDENGWRAVLTDGFKLSVPITPYRSYNPSDVVNNKRVVVGIEGMCQESASLNVLYNCLGSSDPFSTEKSPHFAYKLSDFHKLSGSPGLMGMFATVTVGMSAVGGGCEVGHNGMFRALFSSDGRLEELDLTYDAISFYHQLSKACGNLFLHIVPNTLEQAIAFSGAPALLLSAASPYQITRVNQDWTELTGLSNESCTGSSPSSLLKVADDVRPRLDEQIRTAASRGLAGVLIAEGITMESTCTFQICSFPIGTDINAGGNIANVLCIVRRVQMNT